MQEGVKRLMGLWDESEHISITDRSLIWNTDLIETLEFDNLISQVSGHGGGRARPRGRAAGPAREDFPKRDDVNWMKHTLSWADETPATRRIHYAPVHSFTLSNEMAYIQPKEQCD